MGIHVNRVPLCRWCGTRIYWNITYGLWSHRPGQVACAPYVTTVAEPTVFKDTMGGD